MTDARRNWNVWVSPDGARTEIRPTSCAAGRSWILGGWYCAGTITNKTYAEAMNTLDDSEIANDPI